MSSATLTRMLQMYQAVLVKSAKMPEGTKTVKGWDFSQGCDLDGIMQAMLTSGFQATALGQAVEEVNNMVRAARCLDPGNSRRDVFPSTWCPWSRECSP